MLANLPWWFTLLLALGLTARLTRIVTRDSITQPVRDHFAGYHKGLTWNLDEAEWVGMTPVRRVKRFLYNLTDCDWCTSVWVGTAVAVSYERCGDEKLWLIVALAATLSHITGWLASREQ